MGLMQSFWALFNGVGVLLTQELFEIIYPFYFTIACFLPTVFLWYTLYFTESRFAGKRWTTWILAIFPLFDFLLLWTNPWHGRLITSYDGMYPLGGDLFPLHALLSYTPLLIGIALLIRYTVKNIRKIPALAYVGGGILLMVTSNVLYTFGALDFGFDITPFTFIVMFGGFAVYSSKLRLFNAKENAELAASKAELEEAQATTFAMFDANPHLNIIFDNRFKVIDCNSSAMDFIGFKTKEEMRAGFEERVARSLPEVQPDGRITTSLKERLVAAVEKGVEKFETELNLEDRIRILDVEFRKIPYEDSFAIIAYAHDITDMRKRELELKKAQETNEWQLAKLNLIIESAKIGMVELELDPSDPLSPNSQTEYSDEYKKLLGYTDEDNSPGNLGESRIGIVHPDDTESAFGAFSAHLLDKTGGTPFDIEQRLKKKNGEYACFRTVGKAIRDKDGNPVRFVNAAFDMTETKNLINEAEKQRQEAEDANKAKSTFLANMSHEIRTPLNAVIGLSDLVLQSDEWNDENYYRLERINNAGTTLLGTVNDILDISKIESGKFELVPGTYDISSMINDAITQSILHRGEKHIEFVMNVCEDLPAQLYGDELRIKQILNNFLSNAFKYTMAGTVELTVSGVREGEVVWLTFIIRDTGIGIRQEDMVNLFSDYVQVDMSANRKIVGTGLGLSIAKRLIELMGGEIKAKSEYGKGSVFTVRLTQKYVNDDIIDPKVVENLKNLNYSDQKRRQFGEMIRISLPYARVLIVDDVITNLDVAKGLMKPYGMKIDCVTSGLEAIEAMLDSRVRYNAVFMDHMMPGMDGIEAAQRIREIESDYAKNIPIIALTANAIVGNEEMFLQNGFQSFISKPIEITHLDAVIREWVRDKEQEKLHWYIEEQNPPAQNEEKNWQAMDKGVPGIKIEKGLSHFNGDKDAYLDVLRSYAKNTPPLLEASGQVDPNRLTEYATIVHGIKGSSSGICAEETAGIAKALENAALAEDYDYVAAHNESLTATARRLISDITFMLEEFDADNLKPKKDKPDSGTLDRLRQACINYEMSGVDAALEELEAFDYELNGELIAWLRENAELMNFDEIVERLSAAIEEGAK